MTHLFKEVYVAEYPLYEYSVAYQLGDTGVTLCVDQYCSDTGYRCWDDTTGFFSAGNISEEMAVRACNAVGEVITAALASHDADIFSLYEDTQEKMVQAITEILGFRPADTVSSIRGDLVL